MTGINWSILSRLSNILGQTMCPCNSYHSFHSSMQQMSDYYRKKVTIS